MTAIVVLVKGHNIWLGLIPTSDIFSLSPIMIISRLGSLDTCLGLVKFPPASVQFPDKYLTCLFFLSFFLLPLFRVKPRLGYLAQSTTRCSYFVTINITIH